MKCNLISSPIIEIVQRILYLMIIGAPYIYYILVEVNLKEDIIIQIYMQNSIDLIEGEHGNISYISILHLICSVNQLISPTTVIQKNLHAGTTDLSQ